MRDNSASGQVIIREANGVLIHQRTASGYFDGTAMCRAYGKQFGHYRQNDTTTQFLEALASNIGIPILKLVYASVGGDHRGTWVHPRVAYHLAQWCSPAFAVIVSGWIDDLVHGRMPDINQGKNVDHFVIAPLLSPIIREQERHSLRLDDYGERIRRLEELERQDPSPKQIALLARVVHVCYGGMDPAYGLIKTTDQFGSFIPKLSQVDHWNDKSHDNRIANLWPPSTQAHKDKTAKKRDFSTEFQAFQNKRILLAELDAKRQPGLFSTEELDLINVVVSGA